MRNVLEFVQFEHTLFSLPLLFAGALLGAGGVPAWETLGWILVAGTGARTVAMSLNRIIDREIDARNPRTASRALPARRLSGVQAASVAAAGLALFYLAVVNLPRVCLLLSPLPLAIFLVYPFLKRFTALAHLGVGAALAFGPLGAWTAVTGRWPGAEEVILLSGFTMLWVAGFDVIYATLDEDFDRREGLHSLPSALGRRRALAVAAAGHALALGALLVLTSRHLSGPWPWLLLGVCGVMLAAEHRLAHRVDLAFFKINSALGFVVMALVWTGVR